MELRIPFPIFYDPAGDARRERGTVGAEESSAAPERRLLCARCGHPITHADHAIAVGGAHEHRFTNPVGLQFHIGCFREASGCIEFGDATTEHTWFAGYAWRIVVCARCRAHLGWLFRGDGDFYGLILARLRSASSGA